MANAITVVVDGQQHRTLRDLLPVSPGLRALFIGKVPAPISVKVGHYFQGTQGKAFWKRLKDYDILRPATAFEDDSMLAQGFGLTDIVKVPREFGSEPSKSEYAAGADRILQLIRDHKPKVAVFIYKAVAEQLVRCKFGFTIKAVYGFNPEYVDYLGTPVSAFSLPGVGACTKEQAHNAMVSLQALLTPVTGREGP